MHDNPHHDDHPESLDNVPDSEQEHHGLDRQTEKRMDSAVGEEDAPQATASTPAYNFDTLNPERAKVRPSGEKPRLARNQDGTDRINRVTPEERLRETSDGVPDNLQEEGSSDSNPPDQGLLSIHYQYRIVATLPTSIQQQIDAALAAVNLPSVVRGFQIQSAFTTHYFPNVTEILQQWAQKYLPLASRLLGVHTEVWGQNQYIAGWKINNVAAWHQAQNELTTQVAAYVEADTNTVSAFRPFIGLLEHTPAALYPILVKYLNEHYEPVDFQITQVSLLRMPLTKYAARVPLEQRTWQVQHYFPLSNVEHQ